MNVKKNTSFYPDLCLTILTISCSQTPSKHPEHDASSQQESASRDAEGTKEKKQSVDDESCQNQLGIIGGQKGSSDKKELSSVVAIESSSGGLCTGTHIGNGYFLTAAHCLRYGLETVITGQDANNSASRYPIIATQGHPQYFKSDLELPPEDNIRSEGDNDIITEGRSFDIAWVKIASSPNELGLSKMVTSSDIFRPGSSLRVAGYGDTIEIAQGDFGVLHWVDVVFGQFIDGVKLEIDDTTFLEFNHMFKLEPETGKGICAGDSGGPAWINTQNNQYLAGISIGVLEALNSTIDPSNGYLCQSGEGLFTQVAPHVDWILESTGLDISTDSPSDSEDKCKPQIKGR